MSDSVWGGRGCFEEQRYIYTDPRYRIGHRQLGRAKEKSLGGLGTWRLLGCRARQSHRDPVWGDPLGESSFVCSAGLVESAGRGREDSRLGEETMRMVGLGRCRVGHRVSPLGRRQMSSWERGGYGTRRDERWSSSRRGSRGEEKRMNKNQPNQPT